MFVTGGAGFVGSNLCRRLQEIGAMVTSVDNYSSGKRPIIMQAYVILEVMQAIMLKRPMKGTI